MKSNLELIKEINGNCLYEIQHIPFYYDGTRIIEKYFWHYELECFINEGKKLYKTEDDIIRFTIIKALDSIIQDIENRKPRALMISDEPDSLKEHIINLAEDFKEEMKDKRHLKHRVINNIG